MFLIFKKTWIFHQTCSSFVVASPAPKAEVNVAREHEWIGCLPDSSLPVRPSCVCAPRFLLPPVCSLSNCAMEVPCWLLLPKRQAHHHHLSGIQELSTNVSLSSLTHMVMNNRPTYPCTQLIYFCFFLPRPSLSHLSLSTFLFQLSLLDLIILY